MVIIKGGNFHIFEGKLPHVCVNAGSWCHHLGADDGPIYNKAVRGNLEFVLSFLTLCWFLFANYCSLELAADCIRDNT